MAIGQSRVVYRRATGDDGQRIFRLNHQVFAAELGQHAMREGGLLVDKFHAKNQYFVAERDGQILGLVSAHTTAPFSVEERCPRFKELVPQDRPIAEVRLLAVDSRYRKTFIACGLFAQVAEFLVERGIELVLISGIVQQKRMYHRLGFRDLGPPARCGSAFFIPMLATSEELLSRNRKDLERFARRAPAFERTHHPSY